MALLIYVIIIYNDIEGVFFMLGIAVFDDEKIIVDYVGELIKENLDVNAKIYKYTKLEEFKGDCKKGILQKINAIYIDIKIDSLNGIEIARKIQQENPKIKIIYMTAYSQYSEAIFKTKPTYLLLKPIKKEQIKKSLERALQEEKQNKSIKTFNIKGKIFNIEVEKIKYIESNKRVVIIYEEDLKRRIYGKLDEIEEMLSSNFVRCHQSYIVNLEYVRELNTHEFVLRTRRNSTC